MKASYFSITSCLTILGRVWYGGRPTLLAKGSSSGVAAHQQRSMRPCSIHRERVFPCIVLGALLPDKVLASFPFVWSLENIRAGISKVDAEDLAFLDRAVGLTASARRLVLDGTWLWPVWLWCHLCTFAAVDRPLFSFKYPKAAKRYYLGRSTDTYLSSGYIVESPRGVSEHVEQSSSDIPYRLEAFRSC